MKGQRRNSVLLAVGLAVAVTVAPAAAQEGTTDRAANLIRAAQAAQELASHSETVGAQDDAVRLHLEIAALPGVDEAQAVESLRTAALYLAYAKPRQASEMMVQAAERALAYGDVVTAAESYLDAASTMVRDGRTTASDFARVESWIARARTLAESPLLTAVDKDRIIQRAGPAPGHYAG